MTEIEKIDYTTLLDIKKKEFLRYNSYKNTPPFIVGVLIKLENDIKAIENKLNI